MLTVDTDQQILVQLAQNPGQTDDERFEFTTGLQGLLRELQQINATGNEAAAELIKYRRNFLKDPSRVLRI